MTVSPRDIEKLKAIGYDMWVRQEERIVYGYYKKDLVEVNPDPPIGPELWDWAKADAQSPEGMKITMADKVRLFAEIDDVDPEVHLAPSSLGWTARITCDGEVMFVADGETPEAAMDALFWSVP